jgi:hypothetical protein
MGVNVYARNYISMLDNVTCVYECYAYYTEYSNWLRDPTERSEFETQKGQDFFLHSVQAGYGYHPTSYPMGTRGSFPRNKQPKHEVDHSLLSSSEVKKMWICTSLPPYIFMA